VGAEQYGTLNQILKREPGSGTTPPRQSRDASRVGFAYDGWAGYRRTSRSTSRRLARKTLTTATVRILTSGLLVVGAQRVRWVSEHQFWRPAPSSRVGRLQARQRTDCQDYLLPFFTKFGDQFRQVHESFKEMPLGSL
jgi:hypothetical protein